MLFLIASLLFWAVFGICADYSFPFSQAVSLITACATGQFTSRVTQLQQTLFQNTELISEPESKRQIKKLTSLEAQAWLYKSVLEQFSQQSIAEPLKVTATLEALEQRRRALEQGLRPAMPWNYRLVSKIQQSARSLGKTQAEKDYEGLELFVANFVSIAKRQKPSRTILIDVLAKAPALRKIASQSVSPQRLGLVYKVEELLAAILDRAFTPEDGLISIRGYQKEISSLNKQIKALAEQLNNAMTERQQALSSLADEKKEALISERQTEYLKKRISSQSAEIDRYESTVIQLSDDLSREAGDADFFKEQSQNFKDQLQEYRALDRDQALETGSLRKELLSLTNRLETANVSRHHLKSELARAQSELAEAQKDLTSYSNQNALLISKASELEQNYSQLLSAYELQKQEIQRLQNELSKRAELVKATQPKLTEDEYTRISNPEDYVYVSGYPHAKSGKWVDAYYRRKPRRNRR